MRLLLELAHSCKDAVRTQRVLPYLVAMLQDPSPLVQADAITLISALLASITTLQPSDTRVMADYVMPALSRACGSPHEVVRCALASSIASLSETSKRFLEIAQWMRVVTLRREPSLERTPAAVVATKAMSGHGGPAALAASVSALLSFDSELGELQEQISRVVVGLASDVQTTAAVKRALLTDITRLCIFMSRQSANDLVLPLLITFLNDRDTSLRASFFTSISGVCAFVGRASFEAFVLPCILQQLSDVEEAVVSAALTSLSQLADVALHTRASLLEIAAKVAPMLTHPSSWVRHGAIGFFAALRSHFSPTDTFCLLRPILRPFLRTPLLSLDPSHLEAALKPSVSRLAFDLALACAAEQQQQHSLVVSSGNTGYASLGRAGGAEGGVGGGGGVGMGAATGGGAGGDGGGADGLELGPELLNDETDGLGVPGGESPLGAPSGSTHSPRSPLDGAMPRAAAHALAEGELLAPSSAPGSSGAAANGPASPTGASRLSAMALDLSAIPSLEAQEADVLQAMREYIRVASIAKMSKVRSALIVVVSAARRAYRRPTARLDIDLPPRLPRVSPPPPLGHATPAPHCSIPIPGDL